MGKKLQQVKEYFVKAIIDRKEEKVNKTMVTFYKVLWDGYPEEQATWERASNLLKSQAIKKEIDNFNNKHKPIQKTLPNPTSHIKKVNNKDTLQLKSTENNSFSDESALKEKIKKDSIELENNLSTKINKNTAKQTSEINSKEKSKEQTKQTNSKSDVVAQKILEKMRKKVTTKNKQCEIPIEQRVKELGDKMKDNVKVASKSKKAPKPSIKNPTASTTQSKPKRKSTLKSIPQQSQASDPILLEDSPQHAANIPAISSIQQKQVPLLSVSCVNRIIDQIIEEKQSVSKAVQKQTDWNKSVMNESIKLEVADDIQQEDSNLKEKQTLTGIDQQNLSLQKDEFVIKGMMVSKNEFFYLVEENGKSEILSRAVMLDKYPYQLIVFYEKRINIKPAEISMMIL